MAEVVDEVVVVAAVSSTTSLTPPPALIDDVPDGDGVFVTPSFVAIVGSCGTIFVVDDDSPTKYFQ